MKFSFKKCALIFCIFASLLNAKESVFFVNGKECDRQIKTEVAELMDASFSGYPYFYAWPIEIWHEYLDEMLGRDDSFLILNRSADKLAAALMAVPVKSGEGIFTNAMREVFKKNNLNPDEYFYVADVLVNKNFQQKGLLFGIEKRFLTEMQKFGYEKICAATIKEEDNSLKPADYKSINTLCERFGFEKTDFTISIPWESADQNGEQKNHTLEFWIKDLAKKSEK